MRGKTEGKDTKVKLGIISGSQRQDKARVPRHGKTEHDIIRDNIIQRRTENGLSCSCNIRLLQ